MEKSEDRCLSDFHSYVWNNYPEFRRLCFHPNNEGVKNKMQASMDKAKGVVAGVADYICLIPIGGYHGLCIEFKLPGGKQSPEQVDFEGKATKVGYMYRIAYSTEEAIEIFKRYLGL